MSRFYQTLISLVADFLAVNVAFLIYYKFREQIPLVSFPEAAPMLTEPMLALCLVWLCLFWLFGLYRGSYSHVRYDELVTVVKAVTLGVVLLFILIFADDVATEVSDGIERPSSTRFAIGIYWAVMIGAVGVGRLSVQTYNRRRLVQGIGRRNALIVGTDHAAKKLYDDIARYPALGMDVKGFVSAFPDAPPLSYRNMPTLGHADEMMNVVNAHHISDVLIALQTEQHTRLLSIIGQCEGKGISLKVVPDMYDIISGAAKTTQLYGVPLIEINPPLLSPLQENLKRLFDIVVSIAVLLLGSPVWIAVMTIVRWDTKASPIYSQTRVGRGGKPFTIYKFRSMRADAEASGPQLTRKNDARITPFGGWMRKIRLDEFPQFFNVLIGDMSVVGPRPERPNFIADITKHAPHYTRLHRVRPGITSWGQVKFGYAENVEEMLERLKYDLFYIENMSLRMDFKILLATVYVVATGRGQ